MAQNSRRGTIAKLVLCFVNLLILLLKLSIIVFAYGKLSQAHQVSHETHTFENIPSWHSFYLAVIVLASLGALVALVGLLAALCDSAFLYKTYIYFVGLGCFLLTTGLIVGLLFQARLTNQMADYFRTEMANTSNIVKFWQMAAMCCGALAPSDWHNKSLMNSDKLYKVGFYPESCCGGRASKFVVSQFQRAFDFEDAEITEEYPFKVDDSLNALNDSSFDYEPFNSSTPTISTMDLDYMDNISAANGPSTSSPAYFNGTSGCNHFELEYRDGCFSNVQRLRYDFYFISFTVATLMVLLLLLTLTCCLERDRQQCAAELVARQYAAHQDTCLYANSGTRFASRYALYINKPI